MLIKTVGSTAEFVKRFGVDNKITRIAVPNSARQSGLIINRSKAWLNLEFGNFPHRLIANRKLTIAVPPNGGNYDIPPNYVGSIWSRWLSPDTKGYLIIHHYFTKSEWLL